MNNLNSRNHHCIMGEKPLVSPMLSFTIVDPLRLLVKVNRALWSTKKYSLPEPVIGGFVCCYRRCALSSSLKSKITFSLDVRDFLLLYFFCRYWATSGHQDVLVKVGVSCLHHPVPGPASTFYCSSNVGMVTSSGFGMMKAGCFGQAQLAWLAVLVQL